MSKIIFNACPIRGGTRYEHDFREKINEFNKRRGEKASGIWRRRVSGSVRASGSNAEVASHIFFAVFRSFILEKSEN